MADWNSKQYLLFGDERTQPAIDLVNRIEIKDPKRIIDIGCGPGNSTEVLARRFKDSYILGVDSSLNMIETAKKVYPNMDFMTLDVSKDLSSLGSDFDIVFSNACIQWVPNHKQLLKQLIGLLKPGGIMAIQTPMNYNEPIHKNIGEVSTSEKWKDKFSRERIFYNLTQSEYFDLLSEIASQFSMWETIYCHSLKSHKDILEWYSSTGLRPYLNVLSEEKKEEFKQDVYEKISEQYAVQKNGNVIFRFPRFFFTAVAK